ncbi:MAG: hypothetical protein HYW28_12440 [Rhodospirillales bacterium]|nr:hypothetical protein [Rhodospirillales bacterium]
MWDFISNYVLPLIATFFVGMAGWFITHFVASPLLEFFRLRKLIHAELFFSGNISDRDSNPDDKDYHAAKSALRRLAARLDALVHSMNWIVRANLAWRKYDLDKASRSLLGFSNSLNGRTPPSKAQFRYDVESALKLPMSYQTRPKSRN